MVWKDWPYWLRGGVIATILSLGLPYIISLIIKLLRVMKIESLANIFNGIWDIFYKIIIAPTSIIVGRQLNTWILTFLLWFIIGSIIGFIYGKIKNRS